MYRFFIVRIQSYSIYSIYTSMPLVTSATTVVNTENISAVCFPRWKAQITAAVFVLKTIY